MRLPRLFILLIAALLSFAACGNDSDTATTETSNTATDKVAEPPRQIDRDRAMSRLEAVIDLSDEQRSLIDSIYNSLQLPANSKREAIRARNRQLREQVFEEVLTDEQRAQITRLRGDRQDN